MPTPFSQSKEALNTFAPRLLAWLETSGRHDLPWQQHQTNIFNPYVAYSKRINNTQSLTLPISQKYSA